MALEGFFSLKKFEVGKSKGKNCYFCHMVLVITACLVFVLKGWDVFSKRRPTKSQVQLMPFSYKSEYCQFGFFPSLPCVSIGHLFKCSVVRMSELEWDLEA